MDHNFLLKMRKGTKVFIRSPHVYKKGPVKAVLEFRKRLDSTSALEKGVKSELVFRKKEHPPQMLRKVGLCSLKNMLQGI